MLVLASTTPSPTPYTAIPATKNAGRGCGRQHRDGDRDQRRARRGAGWRCRCARRAARRAPSRRRRAAPSSAAAPTARGPRGASGREKSGSRVVRLMKTKPWVAKPDGDGEAGPVRCHGPHRGTPGARSLVWWKTRGVSTHEVWLVRHGETEWSKAGRHTSVTDLPLTPVGEAVAPPGGGAAGRRGVRAGADQPAAARPAYRRAARARRGEVDDDLVEWGYGDYEGITNAADPQDRPGLDPVDAPGPGRRDRRTR